MAKKNQTIIIRPATLSDLIEVKSLWIEFMDYHARFGDKYLYLPDEWPRVYQRFTQAVKRENAIICVAEIDKTLVGYVFGFIFSNFPGYFPKTIGFINDLYVTNSKRKQGIASKLVRTLEIWFAEQDISVIQLYVASSNVYGQSFWQKRDYEQYSIGLWKEVTRTTNDDR